jgi:DNA-binding transcriptional LysR family regulator
VNVTVKQLKIFLEVARRRNMMHAAAALHLTPPAVSMQIKEMERQVGLSLFDRNKRHVALSTAGEYFVTYATSVLAKLKEAETALARFKGLDGGVLTIGIVSTTAYFVPRLLARFHEKHPGVDVKLRVVNSRQQLLALMNAAEVDLMVLAQPLAGISSHAEVFAANPLVFVCPPRHPLLKRASLSANALNERPLIVREQGSRTRAVLETFLLAHKCTPQITMEIPSVEMIKQAVMAGLGLGFLSLQTVGLELRHGLLKVLAIADTPVMDVWNIVHLQSRVLSPAAEAFRRFVIERGNQAMRADDAILLSLAFKKKIARKR